MSVGIRVALINEVTAGMLSVTRALGAGEGAAKALNAQLRQSAMLMAGGGALVAGGMAMLAPLKASVEEAAKLQLAIKNVQLVTQASNTEMRGFSELLSSVADATAIFSKADVAAFAREMGKAGIRNLHDIKELLPIYAKAADVLKKVSGASPAESAHSLAAVAHQFGVFDAKSMRPIVDNLVALGEQIPGSLRSFVTMGSYVHPIAKRIQNVNLDELLALEATAFQTSGGGGAGARGALSGNNLANLLARTVPGVFGSGLFQGKSAYALRTMGLVDEHGRSTLYKDGRLSIQALSDALFRLQENANTAAGRVALAERMLAAAPLLGKKAGDVQREAQDVIATRGEKYSSAQLLMPLLRYAFGSADKAAALLGTPAFRQQLLHNEERERRFRERGGVEAQQKELLQTFDMQLQRLGTNLKSVAASLGTPLLGPLLKFTDQLASMANQFNRLLEAHPMVARFIDSVIVLSSAFVTAAGAALILRGASLLLAIPLATLGPTAVVAAAGILTLSAAIALYPKMTGWMEAHKGALVSFVQKLQGMNDPLKMLLSVVAMLPGPVGALSSGLLNLRNSLLTLLGSLPIIGEAFRNQQNREFKSFVNSMAASMAQQASEGKFGPSANSSPAAQHAPTKKPEQHITLNSSNTFHIKVAGADIDPKHLQQQFNKFMEDAVRTFSNGITTGMGVHRSPHYGGMTSH